VRRRNLEIGAHRDEVRCEGVVVALRSVLRIRQRGHRRSGGVEYCTEREGWIDERVLQCNSDERAIEIHPVSTAHRGLPILQRKPRLTVRLGLTFQSSCANASNI